jgi:hypothetical protein
LYRDEDIAQDVEDEDEDGQEDQEIGDEVTNEEDDDDGEVVDYEDDPVEEDENGGQAVALQKSSEEEGSGVVVNVEDGDEPEVRPTCLRDSGYNSKWRASRGFTNYITNGKTCATLE